MQNVQKLMLNIAKVDAKCNKSCCQMQQKMMQNVAKVNAISSKVDENVAKVDEKFVAETNAKCGKSWCEMQ